MELDPRKEAEKISDAAVKLAMQHPPEERDSFVASIIVGNSMWAESTRGLARCKIRLAEIELLKAANFTGDIEP